VLGVTNGKENRLDKFSKPRLFPSIKDTAANPNIILTKNAPKSKIFVICHMTNCSGLSLKSLKLGMLFEIGCCVLFPISPIAVLIPYQKIDDLPRIFTRTRAIAERMIVETRE
jgi:hypothetical protein